MLHQNSYNILFLVASLLYYRTLIFPDKLSPSIIYFYVTPLRVIYLEKRFFYLI